MLLVCTSVCLCVCACNALRCSLSSRLEGGVEIRPWSLCKATLGSSVSRLGALTTVYVNNKRNSAHILKKTTKTRAGALGEDSGEEEVRKGRCARTLAFYF